MANRNRDLTSMELHSKLPSTELKSDTKSVISLLIVAIHLGYYV